MISIVRWCQHYNGEAEIMEARKFALDATKFLIFHYFILVFYVWVYDDFILFLHHAQFAHWFYV